MQVEKTLTGQIQVKHLVKKAFVKYVGFDILSVKRPGFNIKNNVIFLLYCLFLKMGQNEPKTKEKIKV